ncbi:MAG TPA: RnfH family protein [Sphingomonadaceae bacterium]|nr:RnfH family protein [Sphingomonadaceae bacterium]
MSRGRKPITIHVEVAYALRERQALVAVEIEEGATIEEAIQHSGILKTFPEIDLMRAKVGIFGRPVALDERMREGDRVEIYRPLIADPKEVRRRKAGQSTPRSRRS